MNLPPKPIVCALIPLVSEYAEAMHVCAHEWNVQERNVEGEARFGGALCAIYKHKCICRSNECVLAGHHDRMSKHSLY